MAEAVLISLAGKLVKTVGSSTFKVIYGRACSIWGARDALQELGKSITTILAVLQDVEGKQEGSAAVKLFVERIKDALYDAEDLLDEVSTNDLLTHQGKTHRYVRRVKVFFSDLNQVATSRSIDLQVKAITNKLRMIYSDMEPFKFVQNSIDQSTHSVSSRRRGDTGGEVNLKSIIGRENDKTVIVNLLCDEAHPKPIESRASLVAVVGIGGVGKTALAQLVYHDARVLNEFYEYRRWWVCISDIFDESVILRKICQSITGIEYNESTSVSRVQSSIRECLAKNPKFLLVLDDLWDDNSLRVQNWLSLVSSEVAQGSKILITTRSSLVATAMNVDSICELKGLSSEASWQLFQLFAFNGRNQQTNLVHHSSLGRKVMEKCANVPLAIKTFASLLRTKEPDEWDSLIDEGLPSTNESGDSISIMPVLKLSYDHLSSNLKHCFAYCALFPKDCLLYRKKLIYLWIAQGFVEQKVNKSLEETGHSYFLELLRRCFFEEEILEETGDIVVNCKMHDLIHDLAQGVAGSESITVMGESTQFDVKKVRHVSIGCGTDESWNFPPPLMEAQRTRSLLFMPQNSIGPRVLEQQVIKLRLLRALNVEGLNLKIVPNSIGELRYLRYLNLSDNVGLQVLPNSITKLVNLLSLDTSGCSSLEGLPMDFWKLRSLVHLDISSCKMLTHMPPGFDELTCLQHLSDFKLSKGGSYDSLAALKGLSLHGQLTISYDPEGGWSEKEVMTEKGQIPKTIQVLYINHYPSTSIPMWRNQDITLIKLRSLTLEVCIKLKHLPRFRCLPLLRKLMLTSFDELEYIEDGDEEDSASSEQSFPCLHLLELTDLPNLKGWSRHHLATNEAEWFFPMLSRICLQQCPLLNSMPPSPELKEVYLTSVGPQIVQQLVSPSSSGACLEYVAVTACRQLKVFPGEDLPSLRKLEIRGCPSLQSLQCRSSVLEDLTILRSKKLKLWDQGEDKSGVNWDALPNLQLLFLDKAPEPEMIPHCLAQRLASAQLQIKGTR